MTMKKILIAVSKDTQYIELVMPEDLFKVFNSVVRIKTLKDIPNGVQHNITIHNEGTP